MSCLRGSWWREKMVLRAHPCGLLLLPVASAARAQTIQPRGSEGCCSRQRTDALGSDQCDFKSSFQCFLLGCRHQRIGIKSPSLCKSRSALRSRWLSDKILGNIWTAPHSLTSYGLHPWLIQISSLNSSFLCLVLHSWFCWPRTQYWQMEYCLPYQYTKDVTVISNCSPSV